MKNASLDVRFAGLERGYRGKLAVKFDCYGSGSLKGVLVATTTSAPVFRSYGAAIKGARRAVATARETGRFPNICTRF